MVTTESVQTLTEELAGLKDDADLADRLRVEGLEVRKAILLANPVILARITRYTNSILGSIRETGVKVEKVPAVDYGPALDKLGQAVQHLLEAFCGSYDGKLLAGKAVTMRYLLATSAVPAVPAVAAVAERKEKDGTIVPAVPAVDAVLAQPALPARVVAILPGTPRSNNGTSSAGTGIGRGNGRGPKEVIGFVSGSKAEGAALKLPLTIVNAAAFAEAHGVEVGKNSATRVLVKWGMIFK